MENIFVAIGWLIVVYILGSVPFGLIIAKAVKGIDLREVGSQNTGATNVARNCGAKYGILTLVLDIAKGFLPVIIATAISSSALFLSLTGLAAIIGHMYSVFLNTKGGKGMATTIGVFAALTPGPLFWSLIICVLLIFATGYVSLGSLTLVTLLPLFILVSGNFGMVIASVIVMFLVYGKHRENILRLARGEEQPWQKKTAENK
ncbi:MAG: glycerol-3-phosphate 1-O-acyltransferase PlsY [Thermodesulfobacteriota bacterium]